MENTKIKIRVVKASKRTFWYANHLGEEFEVEKCLTYYQQLTPNGEITRRYELRFEGEWLRHFLHEKDCIVL